MRLPKHPNPNPNLVTQGFTGKTSRQIRSHLLCPDCEKRLDKNGEEWVIRNCYRGKGVFRLREMLVKGRPIESTHEASVYNASQFPGLDYHKLAYFAMSVYWRGSLQQWNIVKHKSETVRLGEKYREEIRRYLLGDAAFPTNALLAITVSQNPETLMGFNFPTTIRIQDGYAHFLHIPGIQFFLVLGNHTPPQRRKVCIVSDHNHPISLSRFGDYIATRQLLNIFRANGMVQLSADGKWYRAD
jgi:hypothetical protein